MINKETIQYINPKLKFSLKKYFPLKEKLLLYDAMLFCSIVSKTPTYASSADLSAFSDLVEACKDTGISLEIYLSCAYSYIKKYSVAGHRLGISYFLNDALVGYCGENIDNFNNSSLFLSQIKDDLILTEKNIRDMMIETGDTYEICFKFLLRNKKLSHFFLAYKKYCNSSLVREYTSEYFDALVNILEPFFTYILAKNNIYNQYKITEWNNSTLEDFNFCPIYFVDRHITNELTEDVLGNQATSDGTKLHKIFETIFTRYNKSITKKLKTIASKYFLSDAYLDVKKELPEHTPFIEKLFLDDTSIFYKLIQPDTKIIIEHKMNKELENLKFYGTPDIILINAGKATILDYKSSKLDEKYLPKNNEKYNKQVSLYAKLLKAEHPEIDSVNGIIVYTRGLIHEFDVLNDNIVIERVKEIENIKKVLKSGVLLPNKSSCFLCKHPNCKQRGRASIWNIDGTRKNNN